jgi:hypothetical protein
MALTRITSNVIKDSTIQESKFDKTYLDATNADTASQTITFESDVNIKVGSAGSVYFKASGNIVTINGASTSATALSIGSGNISLTDGDVTLTGTREVLTPYLTVAQNGTSASPSLRFNASASTGVYYTESPQSLSFSVNGTNLLSLSNTDAIKFGNRELRILGQTNVSYEEVIRYNINDSKFQFGGGVNKLDILTGDDIVINVRSVDSNNAAYPNNENRVGVNTTNPQATFDVSGSIRATSYQNISNNDLPVVEPLKGGTGLSGIGQPEQLIRVKNDGTGLEYFTAVTGDVNNLSSFGVSGDGNLYTASARGSDGLSRLTLTIPSTGTFIAGQPIKIFGINTRGITQYDANTVDSTTIYSSWASTIDNSQSPIIAQGNTGGNIRYKYYAALINFNTGIISSLKKLKHSSDGITDYVENFELNLFNEQRYNSVSITRPNASHGILLYRYKNVSAIVKDRNGNTIPDHDSRLNLIAIIGQRDIGSSTSTQFTYNDYGPYDRTTWGDFNTDGSYNAQYQKITGIPVSVELTDIPNYGPYPGWSERQVADVDYINNLITITNATNGVYDSTELSSIYIDTNKIQVCHDDTAAIQAAIDTQVQKGLFSLLLIGGTYLVKRLVIPSNFSLSGAGKATVIKKQYFDTSYNTTPSPEFSRLYSAIWMREAVSNNASLPIKDASLSSFVVDGNYNCNIRLGTQTRPDSNALVYLEESENCSLFNLDIKNSIGDALYAPDSRRLSLQNTSIYDNSITYITFDNPFQATDTIVLRVSDCSFLSNPGPVDITTTQVVAFNSCIIRNSGTGLRTYGTRSANVENNLILGPDDEWIPTTDIYDSDFNSINITCYKSTGAGTGGLIKFTYVEENIAKDLSNTTITPYVYKVNVDSNGNEIIDPSPLTYIPTGKQTPESVLVAQIYDKENGGIQIKIPESATVPAPVGTALEAIPYRTITNNLGTNYSYLIYYVNVSENVSVGDPDDYIINGVIGYNQLTQIYTIKIDESTIADFATGDIVQVLEHNTTNGYSLPNELTVATSPRFEQQSYVLDLFSSSFNTFNSQVNGDQTAPNGSLTIDPLARGYIKKKRLFTVAKGIIGVK